MSTSVVQLHPSLNKNAEIRNLLMMQEKTRLLSFLYAKEEEQVSYLCECDEHGNVLEIL